MLPPPLAQGDRICRSLHLAPLAGRGRRALARRVRGPLRECERVESPRPPPPPPPPQNGGRGQKTPRPLWLRPFWAPPTTRPPPSAPLWKPLLAAKRAPQP